MVSIREFDKRLKALEDKGQEIDLIGRKPRPLRVQRQRALTRILERLILIHKGSQIVIAVTEVPQLSRNHLSLGLALQIPVGKKKAPLSKANKRLLETFLLHAIEESAKFRRPESPRLDHPHHGRRSSQRRSPTGS